MVSDMKQRLSEFGSPAEIAWVTGHGLAIVHPEAASGSAARACGGCVAVLSHAFNVHEEKIGLRPRGPGVPVWAQAAGIALFRGVQGLPRRDRKAKKSSFFAESSQASS